MGSNNHRNQDAGLLRDPLFDQLKTELTQGLQVYWETAAAVLQDSGIRLLEAGTGYFALERNLFSSLFLYSFVRGGIPSHRRTLYVALNQCLRGMVTGCDNLLDDEYKPTLLTDLPEKAIRFRSVLDIMVSDRVLFELLLDQRQPDQIPFHQVLAVSRASLGCLARSGAQEASEEKGVGTIPAPEEVLRAIHHFKTGLLFQAPWAAPEILEKVPADQSTRIKAALYDIGMGCQILDDMVDLERDLRDRRYNFVASLIHHQSLSIPQARRQAASRAQRYLQSGLQELFEEAHAAAVPFFFNHIVQRIGAESYLHGNDLERL